MEWMLMPLKRYADFQGRSRRMEFWMYNLGVWLLFVALTIVAMVIGFGSMGMASQSQNPGAGLVGMMAGMGLLSIVFLILALGLFIPSIAVAVRRPHDTDRSGFWLLMPVGFYLVGMVISFAGAMNQSSGVVAIGLIFSLLQFIASIVLLVFYCLPGTPGPNKYGPDPMGGAGDLSQTFQ